MSDDLGSSVDIVIRVVIVVIVTEVEVVMAVYTDARSRCGHL